MIIQNEPAEKYHARAAVSAGFLWRWIDQCGAQAYHESAFNPKRPEESHANELEFGKAAHLAVLENSEFADRCSLVAFKDWRTKESREIRDQCYIDGKIPLLKSDYELVNELRSALGRSHAAELLFGEGRNEVSYTWGMDGHGVPCKARADRKIPHAIVDLKTAMSASPGAFERAMDRDGHHLRAAWYIDGWMQQPGHAFNPGQDPFGGVDPPDYIFVVVSKVAPHLVSVFSTGNVPAEPGWFHISEESIDKGRLLYRRALVEFRRAREAGVWPVYSGKGENKRKVSLPAYRLNLLYAQERAGDFDEDEIDSEIPY